MANFTCDKMKVWFRTCTNKFDNILVLNFTAIFIQLKALILDNKWICDDRTNLKI